MAAKEVDLQQQKVFGHLGLRSHVGDPGQWQDFVLASGAQQMGRQLESVGGEHVVVGQSVDQQ